MSVFAKNIYISFLRFSNVYFYFLRFDHFSFNIPAVHCTIFYQLCINFSADCSNNFFSNLCLQLLRNPNLVQTISQISIEHIKIHYAKIRVHSIIVDYSTNKFNLGSQKSYLKISEISIWKY